MTSTAEEVAPDPPEGTAAIVLAAGRGRRFAGDAHKLLTMFRGRPVVVHAVESAREAGFFTVIVVTGAVDLSQVLPEDVRVVENPDWATGQASSLQVGIAAALEAGADAVVVGLGDQPLIGTGPWREVANATSPIAVASYQGRRRNPVRLAQEVWSLLPKDGDEGARAVMRVRSELVSEVPCEGEPADIDTLEDLDRWN